VLRCTITSSVICEERTMLVPPIATTPRYLSRVAHIIRRTAHQTASLSYSLYYDRLYERRFPFAHRLAQRIESWERQHHRGDIPADESVWSQEYASGRWAFLRGVSELARYSVLVGYLRHLKPGGSVLDIGCGEGLLFRRYRDYGYSRYVGIEISAAALTPLQELQNDATTFVCVDAETYQPKERFDAIVFNETLYYFREPLALAARYAEALHEDGVMLVSTYVGSARARAILRLLKKRFRMVDETTMTHDSATWVCTVFDGAGPKPLN
jgi:SAM-dependent methyltransferase